jgi:D-arabinonate dehydratase
MRVHGIVEAGAVDLVNFDASEGGGVTEWRRAAEPASRWQHEEPQIAQHPITAVPHGTCVERLADPARDPAWQAMWANRRAIKDGAMEVTRARGFGPALDEDMIRRYRVG